MISMQELDRKVTRLMLISTFLVVVVKVLATWGGPFWLIAPLVVAWIVLLFRLSSTVPQLPYDYFFDRGYGWSLLYAGYWLLVLIPFQITSSMSVILPVALVAAGWVYALVRWLRNEPDEDDFTIDLNSDLESEHNSDLDAEHNSDLDSTPEPTG